MNEQEEKLKEARHKSYEKLMKEWETIKTWSDFFEMIDKKVRGFRECGCAGHAIDAMMTQYAFITTLKELPDEGDIQKLVEHMARMMVYEGEQKLGTSYIDDEEAQRLGATANLAARLLGGNLAHVIRQVAPGVALIDASGGDDAGNAGAEEGDKPSKKHLH